MNEPAPNVGVVLFRGQGGRDEEGKFEQVVRTERYYKDNPRLVINLKLLFLGVFEEVVRDRERRVASS